MFTEDQPFKLIKTEKEYKIITAKIRSLKNESDLLEMEQEILELKILLEDSSVYHQFCNKQIDLLIKQRSDLSGRISRLRLLQENYDVITETIDVLKTL